MDKATMLYNKFKSMFLVGEGDCVLSQVLNRSLAEQRQHEEKKKKAEQAKENNPGIYIFFHIINNGTGCLTLNAKNCWQKVVYFYGARSGG